MPSLNIPDTKFVLPTAQRRPISINGGMAMPGNHFLYFPTNFHFIEQSSILFVVIQDGVIYMVCTMIVQKIRQEWTLLQTELTK